MGLLASPKAAPCLHDMIRRNFVGNGSAPILRLRITLPSYRREFQCNHGGLWCRRLWTMWCRILRDTPFRAALVPEPLTLYRFRNNSMSLTFYMATLSAESAMESLWTKMPEAPERVFREGYAEHYNTSPGKQRRMGDDGSEFACSLKLCGCVHGRSFMIVGPPGPS